MKHLNYLIRTPEADYEFVRTKEAEEWLQRLLLTHEPDEILLYATTRLNKETFLA